MYVHAISLKCVYCWHFTLLQLIIPGTNHKLRSAEQQSSASQQTPVDNDTARSTKADKQSSVPHLTAASGLHYALSDKVSFKDTRARSNTEENQGVCNYTVIYA